MAIERDAAKDAWGRAVQAGNSPGGRIDPPLKVGKRRRHSIPEKKKCARRGGGGKPNPALPERGGRGNEKTLSPPKNDG